MTSQIRAAHSIRTFFLKIVAPVTLFTVFASAGLCLLAILLPYYNMLGISIIKVSASGAHPIWVYETKTTRCLSFTHPSHRHNKQTCLFLSNNVVPYSKYVTMVLGALYIQPNPKKILIIGLGGGAIARALKFLKPDAIIEIVEINPEVVDIARTYFPFEIDAPISIHIDDGFNYIQTALKQKKHYDLVILDAFNSEYIPKQFLTVSFARMVKGILTKDGVAAINTFTSSASFQLESDIFQNVFGKFYNLVRLKLQNSAQPLVICK
jgi:spermidine synthase